MLPSGNDAAVCLAEGFNTLLKSFRCKQQNKHMEIFRAKATFGDSSYPLFIKEMNAVVPRLHLKHTKYTNPHGLSDKANHSTANELAQISVYAMRHPLFREIVNTKQYHTQNTYFPLARFLKRHRDVKELP